MDNAYLLRIEALLAKSELDSEGVSNIKNFFESIANEPQFVKIVDLLERFPSVFENFIKCFDLKRKLVQKGISKDDWQKIVKKDEEEMAKLQN